jgi:hypothetical protein
MDRRLLFPLIAVTASAQQAPSPRAVQAEKALRSRVEQFYQFQVDKKYRQAEAFVAEDTKDLFIGGKKPDTLGFSIQKVELLDRNTKAKVTVKAKSSMMMIGVGRMPLEVNNLTLWKIEHGQWVWYVDAQAPVDTPFGKRQIAKGTTPPGAPPDLATLAKGGPDPGALTGQVEIDRASVVLTADQPASTVIVSNHMPGFVEVSVERPKTPGLSVEVDKPEVAADGKANVRIRRTENTTIDETVHILVSPLNLVYDVHVTSQ